MSSSPDTDGTTPTLQVGPHVLTCKVHQIHARSLQHKPLRPNDEPAKEPVHKPGKEDLVRHVAMLRGDLEGDEPGIGPIRVVARIRHVLDGPRLAKVLGYRLSHRDLFRFDIFDFLVDEEAVHAARGEGRTDRDAENSAG